MNIEVTESPDTYIWKTTFKSEKLNIVKDYLLRERDAQSGSFEIDEQDGIIIPCRFFDNELWSLFEVDGTFIIGLYSMTKNTIIVNFPSANSKKPERSGGNVQGNDTIPIVTNYLLNASQKIILHKKSN
ncbi:MAG: hypothetical protein WED33_07260 [Bacteroidia bacterium]